MAHSQDRRSFLRWATISLGALFSAIFGFPIVVYLADPRNRIGKASDFIRAEGIRLNEVGDVPVQGVIRTVRVDGWTLHPSDVVGRIWVVKDATAARGYRVFTTICPHLGCSVNMDEGRFRCPCHNAQFAYDGERRNPDENPALRGMDELEWRRDPIDPQRILVHYQTFRNGVEEKEVIQ